MKRGDVGPPCPNCGCNDTTVQQVPTAGSWFANGQAVCNSDTCLVEFYFSDDPQVSAQPAERPPDRKRRREGR